MSPNAEPVVVLLAFANDRAVEARYLRQLNEEQRRVRHALASAELSGHCRVVECANATAGEILDAFQHPDVRDRVAIFHFGGHAGSGELILESRSGHARAASAAGLAAFLGQQRSLGLVFLNGCSSKGQVRGLLDAGAAAVIATSQAIDDTVATDFAVRFYRSLAGGTALRTAFDEAQAAIQTHLGDDVRSAYRSLVPQVEIEDNWPWELHVAEGAAQHPAKWSLPLAASDPLFGLPRPPAGELPASPYKNLKRYTRDDAEIFFGRNREIRDLYEAVTAPGSPPIVLLFGATGVGKSSLLDAGLRPRLEAGCEVVYRQRDPTLGLSATLNDMFSGVVAPAAAVSAPEDAVNTQLEVSAQLEARVLELLAAAPPEPTAVERTTLVKMPSTLGSLGSAWCKREKITDRPLVVILDQLEEAYTRPAGEPGREVAELIAMLQDIFAVREERPRGRLILGFRKEWLAEMIGLLDAVRLPYTRVEVQTLDRDGIIEVVSGPASNERLRQQYRLDVDELLPPILADDLREDPSAAIAPALQILLSHMWTYTSRKNPGAPAFSVGLYQERKRQGILLDDFIERHLSLLRRARPEAVDSGLVLDLLMFHTSPLGTAVSRTATEVIERYEGRSEVLELLQPLRELYLLDGTVRVVQGEVVGDPHRESSRLAHDTLARLVRQRFEASDLPGQRALRILIQRADAWAGGREGPILDPTDLQIVEAGASGMRARTEDEERLVAASHLARRSRGQRRAASGLLAASLLVVAALAGMAWAQRGRALEAEQLARAEAAEARQLAEREARDVHEILELVVDLHAAPDPDPRLAATSLRELAEILDRRGLAAAAVLRTRATDLGRREVVRHGGS